MSIFYIIFFVDLLFLGLFFLMGKFAVDKESKDTWGDSKTMEFKKSRKLSKEWTKKHPILDFFQSFYYELERKKDIPGDTYRNTKWFIQRGKRGYSDCDVWEFYDYLTDVIINGLKDLQRQVHGSPCGFANSHSVDIECESPNTKEWKKTIGKTIWTFEAIKKIEDHEWLAVHKETDREELKKFVKRYNRPDKEPLFEDVELKKMHLMTKAEMKKYEEGWKLFKQFYFDLWD